MGSEVVLDGQERGKRQQARRWAWEMVASTPPSVALLKQQMKHTAEEITVTDTATSKSAFFFLPAALLPASHNPAPLSPRGST
jgi:hypothetical protein